jgi:ribosome assembly protein 4
MCFEGPQLDVPHDVTPKQLETLLNGLLNQEEKLPYSFFIHEQQLSEELGSHLLKNKVRMHDIYTACLPAAVCVL